MKILECQKGKISSQEEPIRFIDLFCGIGGFRFAMENATKRLTKKCECVFSSDFDEGCQRAYASNFGDSPFGDIKTVNEKTIPDHDILLAGFPCQPFSIIGQRKGFEDTRGTLFFDIARILDAKKPKVCILENVKLLKGHNNGSTLKVIFESLSDLGYEPDFRILNALDFGLPQKRERIWIVGIRGGGKISWNLKKKKMQSLSSILEQNVPKSFYASDEIRKRRHSMLTPTSSPTIWHENKAGHISAYPYSCALRAGASYNYLLVDGLRRLTPREMLRLQGFQKSSKLYVLITKQENKLGIVYL